MDYEKAYKDALEKASKLRVQNPFDTVSQMMEYVFPELKESDDERIRKGLITIYRDIPLYSKVIDDVRAEDIIKWLEKQGAQKKNFRERYDKIADSEWFRKTHEGMSCGMITPEESLGISSDKYNEVVNDCIFRNDKKPIDKIEPKFHEGDWVVWKNNTYLIIANKYRYDTIDQKGYETNFEFGTLDEEGRLWDIKDAKDGDVLVHNNCTFIFMGIKDGIVQAIEKNFLKPVSFGEPDEDNDYRPATKEQRDALMKAMTNAGYTFDFEKKELREIEKQGNTDETINKDKFAQGVLRGAALNLITWIDYNAAEGNICLSNAECKDIEDALASCDWDKIYGYIKNKLEKQGEQKPVISNDVLKEGVAHFGITQYQIDNWLKKYVDVEKQGEHNLTDKVGPKFKLEHDKWYRCILTPVVHKHFTVGKVYKCELEGCLVDDINEDRIVDLDLECFRPATEDEIPQEKSEVKVAIADLETPQDPILLRLDRIYKLLFEIKNNTAFRLPYITTTPYIPQPQQPWYDTGKVYCDKASMETTTNTIEDERPETTM